MLLQDSTLPHLTTALDVSAMQEHFGRHLRAANSDLEWEPAQCAIEKIYYRPGHHCGILYRLSLRHPSGREVEEWFFGRMYPPHRACNQLERAGRAIERFGVSHEFLKRLPPLSFWHDLNMILWVFPQDPKITTLSAVIDPDFVRQEIQANWPAFGVAANVTNGKPGTWRCADLEYDRVKYMPCKRCVLRFHMNVVAPSGEPQRVRFYSKTYRDGWSAYHFAMTKSVHEQLAAQTREINLPKPLLHLDGFNTYWQAEWAGDAIINVLAEENWEELFPRIAAMIAALHRSRVQGLRPGPDLDEVLDTAREDGALLMHLLPQVQPFIRPVLEGLETEKRMIARRAVPAVPIHGACRIEQMLVRKAELALVDFDAVSTGDPYYDLAEFVASLRYLEITRGFARSRLQRAAELFCRHYGELVPGFKYDAYRLAWYARAFLITKMFSSIKNLDLPALQRLESVGREIITGWRD